MTNAGLALSRNSLVLSRNTRKFNPAQLNYPTLQKELLAIIDSLKFFEAQLRGTKFTILTDHKPLETFMDRTQATQKLRR